MEAPLTTAFRSADAPESDCPRSAGPEPAVLATLELLALGQKKAKMQIGGPGGGGGGGADLPAGPGQPASDGEQRITGQHPSRAREIGVGAPQLGLGVVERLSGDVGAGLLRERPLGIEQKRASGGKARVGMHVPRRLKGEQSQEDQKPPHDHQMPMG